MSRMQELSPTKRLVIFGAGALSFNIVLSACGAEETLKDIPSAQNSPSAEPGKTLEAKPKPTTTYSTTLRSPDTSTEQVGVYSGFSDKEPTVFYPNDTKIAAECLLYGRYVRSAPEAQDTWIAFQATALGEPSIPEGTRVYAPLSSVENPNRSLNELPYCFDLNQNASGSS